MSGSGEFQQRAFEAPGRRRPMQWDLRFRGNPAPGDVIFLDRLPREPANCGDQWLVLVGNSSRIRCGSLACTVWNDGRTVASAFGRNRGALVVSRLCL